ncbi:MAG: protein translocase SEC61 complex subunit gamma [Methanosarcinales archaeon Met12]|nr:MAG: protein translocase SEC61 complex subunit gamma [Methanosarcinales archaeon Met12]
MAKRIDSRALDGNISTKINEYMRIIRLARKPSKEEFNMVSKVCIMGALSIGLIGFLLYFVLSLLPQLLIGN